MSYIKRFFGHLKTVLTHKRWVFYYASSLGYPWIGFVHDLSKFSPVEFFESVKYWTGERSPINAAKETVGISYAWLHHRGRNKHHYEYWVDVVGDKEKLHKIPFKYVIEMVCDWLAACRTYTNDSSNVFVREYSWWQDRAPMLKINGETKMLITKILWNLANYQRVYGGDEMRALDTIAINLDSWKKTYDNPAIE